jgi:hypothetical protein
MKFFDNARFTVAYPVGDIVSIDAAKNYSNSAGRYHEVRIRNGSAITVPEHIMERITNPTEHRIPAAPGYSVYHPIVNDAGESKSYSEPVIAWAFKADGDVIPITVRGEWDGMMRTMSIMSPDGQIYLGGDDAVFPNEAECIAYLLSQPDAENDGILGFVHERACDHPAGDDATPPAEPDTAWTRACDHYAAAREAEDAGIDSDLVDALVEARCDAERAMLRCPAPDLASVLFKIEYGDERYEGRSWPDECWAAVIADIRRLASIPSTDCGNPS